MKTVGSAAVVAWMMVGVAHAAVTPETKCQAGKNDAAGRYAACTAKAEKAWVTAADSAKYGESLAACEEKLVASWSKLESAALDDGANCPSTGDLVAIEDYVDSCVQGVAIAVGGGALPPDPAVCAADLATCQAGLASCSGGLATCDAALAACEDGLASTNGNLATCSASLTAAGAGLAACNSDLTATNADLGACVSDLADTGSALSTCDSGLTACESGLATCSSSLAPCLGGTAGTGDVRSGRTFSSGGVAGRTGTMTEVGAQNVTPGLSTVALLQGRHNGSGTVAGDADLAASNIASGVTLFGVAGTAGAVTSQVLRTGQTTCSNLTGPGTIACAGSGQDGETQRGAARSFTDNGDGTITDNVTGLMWEKLSDDGSIHDKDLAYNWDGAFTSKRNAVNTAVFAGYSDWRVPNVTELTTLRVLDGSVITTYPVFLADCAPGSTVLTGSCTTAATYWTNDSYAAVPTSAWDVTFSDGSVSISPKIDSARVRLVRGGI